MPSGPGFCRLTGPRAAGTPPELVRRDSRTRLGVRRDIVTPESGPRAGGGGPQENLNLSLSDQEHCR